MSLIHYQLSDPELERDLRIYNKRVFLKSKRHGALINKHYLSIALDCTALFREVLLLFFQFFYMSFRFLRI